MGKLAREEDAQTVILRTIGVREADRERGLVSIPIGKVLRAVCPRLVGRRVLLQVECALAIVDN